MEKKIIIVCEGKNDVSYLNALQRFVENDIPLPPGQLDPFLRFVPFPELEGTCTGQYDKIVAAYIPRQRFLLQHLLRFGWMLIFTSDKDKYRYTCY